MRAKVGIALALALGVMVLILGPTTGSARGTLRHCGDHPGGTGAGWYNVRAVNIRCRPARHVARHYWHTWSEGHPDHRFRGWHCVHRQVGEEAWKGHCHRHRHGRRQVVRFDFGF